MTPAEFNQWFAETGHKWRGWPEWSWFVGKCHLALNRFPAGYVASIYQGGVRQSCDTHTAACLIRDHLMFHPDMHEARIFCLRATREELNKRLADAVEAKLKEGGKG